MYVLLGYHEDYYEFESFIGVFSSKEKAQEYRDNDYHEIRGEKYFTYGTYEIYEIKIDEPITYKTRGD